MIGFQVWLLENQRKPAQNYDQLKVNFTSQSVGNTTTKGVVFISYKNENANKDACHAYYLQQNPTDP